MKKTLSLVLTLALILGAFAVVPTTASAKEKKPWFQADSCDTAFSFVNQCSACRIEVDSKHKMEGEASIKFNMADWYIRDNGQFCFKSIFTLEDIVDIDEYPIFEYNTMVWEDLSKKTIHDCDNVSYSNLKTGELIQVNFIDTDVEHSDGINVEQNLNGDKDMVWTRKSIDLTDRTPAIKHGEPIPLARDNIGALRFSGIQSKNDEYWELDVNIDNLVFMTAECKQERDAEEVNLKNDLNALPIPLPETVKALEAQILAAKQRIEDDKVNYPNFIVDADAQDHFDDVYDAYLALNKDTAVKAAHDAIEAIGEITVDNYYSVKKPLLEEAEGQVAKLDELFGEEGYTLDNKQTLLDARATYDSFSDVAVGVRDEIEELPEYYALKPTDAEAVYGAKARYDALSDDQKTEVGVASKNKLDACVTQMDKLSKYGDINGDSNVNATDALMALQAASGKIQLTDLQIKKGDVDGNKTVNTTDALLILQKASGKIDKFPIEK